jgi:alpha,alpha-trehalose phosphorylase
VISHPAFPAEPWCLHETGLDLDVLAQTESLLALSNGHVGWRGNLDQGEPGGLLLFRTAAAPHRVTPHLHG